MNNLRNIATVAVVASLALMAGAAPVQKKSASKARSLPAMQKQQAPKVELGGMVGTWTMRDGEKPLTHIRMVFRPDGSFAFVGPNWKSAGRYKVAEHKLSLEWNSVDGEKIAPGTMKKDFSMAEDDSSFTIDKYTYFKLNR
jgi:hypothetical protein